MKQENLVIFVKRDLLTDEKCIKALRDFSSSDLEIPRYSMITGVSDGDLVIKNPPTAFADVHLDDYALCTYDAQAVIDGFIKLTMETLTYLVDSLF